MNIIVYNKFILRDTKMKVNNFEISLSKDDILKLMKLQDKITIKSLSLSSDLRVNGFYRFIGINVEFDSILSLSHIKNNTIYIMIQDFKVSKKDKSSPLVKGSISVVTKSINDIEGMDLKSDLLTIDIEKIIKVYLTDTYGVKLNSLNIDNLTIKNNEIQLILKNIDLTFDIR